MNKGKVIVFGATGGVGAYTCVDLLEKGYDVVALGHRKSDNGFFEGLGAEYMSVDICCRETFEALPIEDVFAVIHLAGMLPARMEGYNPQKYIDCNVTGTLNVLDYAVRAGAERFVYAQSIADVDYLLGTKEPVRAEAESRFPLDNDHSVYSITKTAAMRLVEHYSAHYGFRQFSLRFPNIYLYNPNHTYYVDGTLRVQGLYRIIGDIEAGRPVELWGDPSVVRDMVYVKDCVQIIRRCLEAESCGGIFNVGTGIGTSRLEQIQGLIDVFGGDVRSEIVFREDKPSSPQYIMDVGKTCAELGYCVEYDYRASLVDMKKERELNRFAPIWGVEGDYSK